MGGYGRGTGSNIEIDDCIACFVKNVFDDDAPIDLQLRQVREYCLTLYELHVEEIHTFAKLRQRIAELEKQAGVKKGLKA